MSKLQFKPYADFGLVDQDIESRSELAKSLVTLRKTRLGTYEKLNIPDCNIVQLAPNQQSLKILVQHVARLEQEVILQRRELQNMATWIGNVQHLINRMFKGFMAIMLRWRFRANAQYVRACKYTDDRLAWKFASHDLAVTEWVLHMNTFVEKGKFTAEDRHLIACSVMYHMSEDERKQVITAFIPSEQLYEAIERIKMDAAKRLIE